jgi:alginate O-acetyltransferase complex protein AlgI
VSFGFLIFSSQSISLLKTDILSLFGLYGISSDISLYYLKSTLPLLIIAAVGSTPIVKKAFEFVYSRSFCSLLFLRPALAALSLFICTAFSVSSGFSAFLYAGF